MNEVTSLILRRMRAPLILIISVYSIAILVLTLIPGVDDKGNVWHMSIYHAFYFVSYTATTIGFGEIPYPLTEGQRLWTIVIIYMTVISWFYALGTVISLIQDKTFQAVSKKSAFKRDIKNIHRPYYVVCGFGETGKAVVDALLEEHFGAVVIEIKEDISDRGLNDSLEYVPNLTANAADPSALKIAGVDQQKCRGVIAVTASDETNLKIAISSKLLHPDVTVVCRSEYKEHEDNMLSFGTDHIINPFESFTKIFSMALHSPSMHLIYEWLTGAPDVSLSSPINIKSGHWILSGYGRFGKQLHKELHKKNIKTIIIDPDEKTKSMFLKSDYGNDRFILGTGTDAATLAEAGIDTAAGVIAGTDNDSNNLSIIMTARQLNKDVFVVGRQNVIANEILYSKINEHYHSSKNSEDEISPLAHLVMQPSEIIARKIRAILIAPLLIDFILQALHEEQEWANITISRLSAVVGDNPPYIWTVNISKDKTPAVAQALGFGRRIELRHIIRNPIDHDKSLACMALLLKRGDELILLPEDDTELKAFDQILFCGLRTIKHTMSPTLKDLSTLNYVMTSRNEPQSYIWKKISLMLHKQDRRTSRR
ncbi:Potassium channel protein [hydrothermal vent metagenome]|uniref:Potassium channel protein n=1 Tax=hydrothermal vent metagenome TaxID=652676 RepID=A0A3B0WPI1_9ZZZZ